MRENKFRGKIIRGSEKGKWMYVTLGKDAIQSGYSNEESYFNNNPVVMNTVGQYTGLKDRNGVEVYEGDILQSKEGFVGKVYFEDAQWFGIKDYLDCAIELGTEAIVIGNIWDNPELLELCTD